jgi:hypothetical protein
LLIVATIDLATDTLKSRNAAFAEPGTLYASKDTLYVASSHWWWWPEIGQSDATYVHAFDLRNPDTAPYLGSGTVDGTVNDQYGMDELDGALRIATHLTTRVADGTPWGTLAQSNRIVARADHALKLLERPRTTGTASGPSARACGHRGFVIPRSRSTRSSPST